MRVEFFQEYAFVLHHRAGVENKAVDTLSHITTVLHSTSTTMVGFELLKDDYPSCPDFGTIFQDLLDDLSHDHVSFLLKDCYFSNVPSYVSPILHS